VLDPRIRAYGISWFHKEDYPRILQIMIDRHVLPSTYSAWKKNAEAQESKWKAEGILIYRAIIDPDEFPAWCKSRGLNVDAKGRVAFASEFAMLQVGKTH
jgi:uncharacterized membrane protein